jgi:hypothetical protein
MIRTGYYEVAGHRISVTGEESFFTLMTNYEPFAVNEDGQEPLIRLSIGSRIRTGSPEELATLLPAGFSEELHQNDDGTEVICGRADGQLVFVFRWFGVTGGWVVCSDDLCRGVLHMTGRMRKAAVDNALMILYALATADKGTALFHSAVVSHKGRAFMFLGKSGTGKSTHARLWLKYIPDTELVNDDNPVVRDGVVYGSPWSGKTPCYRNVKYPIGGIVMLSQAPYNKILPLRGISAYAALVPSISGMRWNRHIADGLHATENSIASTIPMWHLECLPDEEAARVCRGAVES